MDNLEAWSFGGSIMTFLIPMLAFAAVFLTLLVLGTKPELVPGRRGKGVFPITATRQPGLPTDSTDTVAESDEAGKAE